MASGIFFTGTVSASGSVRFDLPPGVTVRRSWLRLTIGDAGHGNLIADTGTISGTSASTSGWNPDCGRSFSAFLASSCEGSDGRFYGGTIVSLTISGRTDPGWAAGGFTFPLAGEQQDQPRAVSGSGTISALSVYDHTAGATVAGVGAIVQVAGGWIVALPALPLGRSYTISATFTGVNCERPAVRSLLISLPVRFTRHAHWLITSPIGPAVVKDWEVRTDIRGFLTTSWTAYSVLHSPLVEAPSPEHVAAALATLHRFAARLWVQWDGTNWTEETDRLISAGGVDDVDLSLRHLNSSEMTMVLDNTDDRFTLTNRASPIASSLRRIGHPVRLEAGYGGHFSTVFFGTLEAIEPRMDDRAATVRVLDKSAAWRVFRAAFAPDVMRRTDEIARALLTDAQFVEGVDFALDVGDVTIPYAIAPHVPLLPELQSLAQAEGGRVFFNSLGVLQFWNRSRTRRAQAEPLVELTTDDHLYNLGRTTAPTGRATRVSMEWATRDSSFPSEIIHDSKVVLRIPAGVVVPVAGEPDEFWPGAPVSIRAMPMDLTRWERGVPAEFESLHTLTVHWARDGSGATVPVTVGTPPAPGAAPDNRLWYTATFEVGYAALTFVNPGTADMFVTTLRLSGRPQRSISPLAVSVADPLAQRDIELNIMNPYLPDADVAMDRAREELALRKDALMRLDVPLQDGLPFLRPFDVLRIHDASVPGQREVIDGQVLANEWSIDAASGYTQRLVLGPALPAQFRGASAQATVRAQATTATDAVLVRQWANPFHRGDVRTAGDPRPWLAEVIAGFTNRALLSTSTDVPAGNPTPFSARFEFTGVTDQMGLLTLPPPLRVGVTYTVRFWRRGLVNPGFWTQAIVGSRANTSGGPRVEAFVWVGAGWEQATLSFTPSGTDCADPVLAFRSWGALTGVVAVAMVTAEHGTVTHPLVWSFGQWA